MNEAQDCVKVDILLATYNGEKYLEQQIDSLLDQSYGNINIIVHDDGSTDSTKEILKKYKDRFPDKFMICEDDVKFGNASDNFMYLSGLADADYIMFCDQDDYWEKEKVETTLKRTTELERKYGKDKPLLVFSAFMAADKDLNPLKDGLPFIYKLDLNHVLVQNCIAGCMCMINRALADKLGKPDKRIIMHDWWMALIAASMGHIEYIGKPLMLYRQHGNNVVGVSNLTSFRSRVRKFKNPQTKKLMFIYEKQAELLKERLWDDMPDDGRKVLKGFLDLFDAPKIKRPGLLRKGNYLKSDFVRAAGQQWYLLRYDKDILDK